MTICVQDLMGYPPVTVRPDDSTELAARRMAERSLHALPVIDDAGHALGVITLADLVDGIDPARSVGQYMTGPPITIETYEPVRWAAERMREHHIHHIVAIHHDEVVGVLSSFDLLGLICNHRLIPEDRGGGGANDGGKGPTGTATED